MILDLIAFDADDTLWHNELLYQLTEEKYQNLLSRYADAQLVSKRLLDTERKNIDIYGYGIKSFTLSMIETAIEISSGDVTASEIFNIIGFAKEMLTSEVRLLDYAEDTVKNLAEAYHLMMITKGDLRDQEYKLARSGLAACFRFTEVVTEKDEQTYRDILAKYKVRPDRFLMVGNSIKSDILPILALGGHAVFVPYQVTWAHEVVSESKIDHSAYHELEHLGQLPGLIEQLTSS